MSNNQIRKSKKFVFLFKRNLNDNKNKETIKLINLCKSVIVVQLRLFIQILKKQSRKFKFKNIKSQQDPSR